MDYELQIAAARHLQRERLLRDRLNPLEFYNESEIKMLFRFQRANIIEITALLEQNLLRETNRNKALQPVQQVCLALRFFATGTMQLTMGS